MSAVFLLTPYRKNQLIHLIQPFFAFRGRIAQRSHRDNKKVSLNLAHTQDFKDFQSLHFHSVPEWLQYHITVHQIS